MKAKQLSLILTLSLTLGAGAAIAAIKYGHIEPVKAARAVETPQAVIPRVVVTASKAQVAEASITRIVVVGRRVDAGHIDAGSI